MYFFCIKIFNLSSIPKLHTYPYVLSLLAFINLGSLYTCSLFKQTFLVGPLHVGYFTSNLFLLIPPIIDLILFIHPYTCWYHLHTFFCWYFVTISILQERSCILSVKSESEVAYPDLRYAGYHRCWRPDAHGYGSGSGCPWLLCRLTSPGASSPPPWPFVACRSSPG